MIKALKSTCSNKTSQLYWVKKFQIKDNWDLQLNN